MKLLKNVLEEWKREVDKKPPEMKPPVTNGEHFGERIIEITELEAEVVDSERISSGNVLAQLIYSGPLLYLHGISTDSVINCERGQLESTKSSAIIMYPALLSIK